MIPKILNHLSKTSFLAVIFTCTSAVYAHSASTNASSSDISQTKSQVPLRQLTLSDITNYTFYQETVHGVRPYSDGTSYTSMNSDGTQIIQYDFRTGKQIKVLFDVATARDCSFKTFSNYQFSPNGRDILIETNRKNIYRRSYTAVHYIYEMRNNKLVPLSAGGPQQVPLFSPDGNDIAFVRNNNIFLVKLLYNNAESQITKDGEFNHVLNGIPDWVYEEEFSFNRAFCFSPDSKMLAYIRFDESAVKSYSFPLYPRVYPHNKQYEGYPTSYTYKYPKAGEDNSKVEVHSYDIKHHIDRKLDIPLSKEGYIPRIEFTNDSTRLAVVTLNRNQNVLELYYANPRSTVSKQILRETSDTYISESALDQLKFYDKHFSFVSDRDGYKHLYWYTLNGQLIKQVTSGQFEVKDFLGWDSKSNSFYYSSDESSPLKQAIYRIDKKGKKTCLTPQGGINRAIFSKNFDYFVHYFNDVHTPMQVTLENTKSQKVLKVLEDNAHLKELLAQYAIPEKTFFTFKTSQGTQLNGWMIKPTDFDPSKKYPVLMYQYSGPQSQEVLDEFKIDWQTYLATQGYITVCVDGRGTGGRGAAFAKCTYMKLGVLEAEDQVETAIYLGTLPYIDAQRIGIWGWSFGGFTTLMSMSEGRPVFKAGIAVAAPTSWRYYDTIYTERFMRTPQENEEGYKEGSCFNRADKLHGDLLLVHGLADDNVHYQNCAEYSEYLVQLDKPFDMQIYTNKNHGIYGGNTRLHLYKRLTRFVKAHL